jgi:hypothetical protein
MKPRAAILLAILAVAIAVEHHNHHDNTTYDPTLNSTASSKQIRWSEAVYDFVQQLDCQEVFIATEKECEVLKEVPKDEMNIYIADPTPYGKLLTHLPDGGLSRTGVHDAVVVLDPYPEANFGHLVLVFYVEIGVDATWCQTEGGHYMGKKPFGINSLSNLKNLKH